MYLLLHLLKPLLTKSIDEQHSENCVRTRGGAITFLSIFSALQM